MASEAASLITDTNINETFMYSRNLSEAEILESSNYMMSKWYNYDDYNKAPGGVQRDLSPLVRSSDKDTLFQDECSWVP